MQGFRQKFLLKKGTVNQKRLRNTGLDRYMLELVYTVIFGLNNAYTNQNNNNWWQG